MEKRIKINNEDLKVGQVIKRQFYTHYKIGIITIIDSKKIHYKQIHHSKDKYQDGYEWWFSLTKINTNSPTTTILSNKMTKAIEILYLNSPTGVNTNGL